MKSVSLLLVISALLTTQILAKHQCPAMGMFKDLEHRLQSRNGNDISNLITQTDPETKDLTTDMESTEIDSHYEVRYIDYAVYAFVAVGVTSLAYVSIPHAHNLLQSAINSCDLNTDI